MLEPSGFTHTGCQKQLLRRVSFTAHANPPTRTCLTDTESVQVAEAGKANEKLFFLKERTQNNESTGLRRSTTEVPRLDDFSSELKAEDSDWEHYTIARTYIHLGGVRGIVIIASVTMAEMLRQ